MRAFKCCISKKIFGSCLAGLTYAILVHDWKKGTFGECPCDEGVIMEVSTGMGGKVILAGTSQREKTIWWHRL